jgi:hypothetical protein
MTAAGVKSWQSCAKIRNSALPGILVEGRSHPRRSEEESRPDQRKDSPFPPQEKTFGTAQSPSQPYSCAGFREDSRVRRVGRDILHSFSISASSMGELTGRVLWDGAGETLMKLEREP